MCSSAGWTATAGCGTCPSASAPTRLLSGPGRSRYAERLTSWYDGGLLLTPNARRMFFHVRDDLDCSDFEFKPETWQKLLQVGPGGDWIRHVLL